MSHKLRSGGKRMIVADQLLQSDGYIDGDALWRSLRSNGIRISPATVYDSLNWLVNAGFAERILSESKKNLFGIKDRFKKNT
ncbi:transcriptional repressor [Dyadobacter aurulentus]|uniref:transcriptional repressor n=1 Tax=Dyadobacter sp. UC 10 TaxID=2605428 RepID=UPI001CED3288|nr:transcriptional repressor [Dyadobacter sp. UC 10]